MIPLSCVNCCHNPLQSDSLGTAFGFCTEHKRVLLAPSHLTCGRQLRKDLATRSARRESELHERRFTPQAPCRLSDGKIANGSQTTHQKADEARLASDPVGETVLEYGKLEKKIWSIAALRYVPGTRSELAMLSLGRAYTRRCVSRGGSWTSGVKLVWWSRRRLEEDPMIEATDLRGESPVPLARRVDLAKWSLIMMRLLFISDLGEYAGEADYRGHGNRIRRLSSLAERAAEATGDLSPRRLLQWVRREAAPQFDEALPADQYERLLTELRANARDEDGAD